LARWTIEMLESVPHKTFDSLPGEVPITPYIPDPSLIEVVSPMHAGDLQSEIEDGGDDLILPTDAPDRRTGMGLLARPYQPTDATPAQPTLYPSPTYAPGARPTTRAEDMAARARDFFQRTTQAQPALEPAQPELATDKPTEQVDLQAVARNLLGVRSTRLGVMFAQPLGRTRQISIAGDFNQWSPTSHPMAANRTLGIFELCIQLKPGRARYRLVIDGVWSDDAYNSQFEVTPDGERTNIVSVGPAASEGGNPEARQQA
jgi:hypothetical protein